ncbi:MAG: hypothetical protein R3B51_05795 [Thermodesulfobacteriota bacterium]
MQTLKDAEYEYFEQDLDDNGNRDFTNVIGTAQAGHGDPSGTDDPED